MENKVTAKFSVVKYENETIQIAFEGTTLEISTLIVDGLVEVAEKDYVLYGAVVALCTDTLKHLIKSSSLKRMLEIFWEGFIHEAKTSHH